MSELNTVKITASAARLGDNILVAARKLGQRVVLHLPSGGMLEITVDDIRAGGVGLVFALSKPYKFVNVDTDENENTESA